MSEIIFPTAFSDVPWIAIPNDSLWGVSTRSVAYGIGWNIGASTNTKARFVTDSLGPQGYHWIAIGV